MQKKYTCKNQFNYTITDLLIDYDKKTYKVGDLFYGKVTKVSKKFINEKIKELELSGFTKEVE